MIGIIIVICIALIAGLILSISGLIFAVPKDEKVEELTEVLPGINCGACGYSGCAAYAKALANNEAENGICPPGGEDTVLAVAEILGQAANTMERKVAVIKCQGHTENTGTKMDYRGINSCQAASLFYGGDRLCQYSCLGKGDCQDVCPENAITMVNGLATVVQELCTGCTICVKTCPKSIIEILPEKFNQHVRCKNIDKGAQTRKVCKTGCLGCMKCQKICELDAITVKNFVASIDYEKCTNCSDCIPACPVNSIA